MQVVIHFGTHGTEPERMIKTLVENRDWLLANGTEVVPPGRYKGVLDEAMASLQGGTATSEMEEVILDALLEGDGVRRMVMSQANLIGLVNRCLSPQGWYAGAGERMRALCNLFPGAQVECSMAIQNPAQQVPFMLGRLREGDAQRVLRGLDPRTLRWGPAMRRIVEALQGRRLIVWCYEDTPLIWPEVVRRVAAMPAEVPLKAGLAVIGDLLTPEGMEALREALTSAGRLTIEARRSIFADVLAAHARPEQLSVEVPLPGWSQDLLDEMTELYDRDVAEIAALPGIEYIAP